MSVLQVHMTRPVGSAGLWLQRILEPVIAACRFQNPPPVEVRPTGRWSGWCSFNRQALDHRVCISNQVFGWSQERLISVYLHECTHRLLEKFWDEVADHGPVFFTLNLLLLRRAQAFFRLDHKFQINFYDLQDQPAQLKDFEDWQEICLRFSRQTCLKFFDSQEPAEALAELVVKAWAAFLQDFDQALTRHEANVSKVKQFDQMVLTMKDQNRFFAVAAGAFLVIYVGSVYLLVRF